MKRMESLFAASATASGSGGSGGGRMPPSSGGGGPADAAGSSSAGQITLDRLRELGKKHASARVHRELAASGSGQSESLELLLDYYLSPNRAIADSESIEWCKWLIAGGRTPVEFASIDF